MPTLGAAGPPQTRVGQDLLVLADSFVVILALGATHPAGVEPVVGAHGDGHEAEGAESPRRGQQHHHAPVAQPHIRSVAFTTLFLKLFLVFYLGVGPVIGGQLCRHFPQFALFNWRSWKSSASFLISSSETPAVPPPAAQKIRRNLVFKLVIRGKTRRKIKLPNPQRKKGGDERGVSLIWTLWTSVARQQLGANPAPTARAFSAPRTATIFVDSA